MRDVIKTSRLHLRPISIDDAPALSLYAGNYEVAKMTGSFPSPFPLLSCEIKLLSFIIMRRQGLSHPYAITLGDNRMIGMVDLFYPRSSAELELGYWVGEPYWGSGYVTEAMQALLDEAENTLSTRTLIANIWYDNQASMSVLKKLGFTLVGTTGLHFSTARLKNVQSLKFIKQLPPLPADDPHFIEARGGRA